MPVVFGHHAGNDHLGKIARSLTTCGLQLTLIEIPGKGQWEYMGICCLLRVNIYLTDVGKNDLFFLLE